VVTLITSIHIFVCVLLIIIVLLQQGKGSDIGAGLGGNNQSVFGARGTASLLSKVTTVAAVTFMCTSLFLAYLSSKESTRSILKDDAKVNVSPTPVASETPTSAENALTTPASPAPAMTVTPVSTPTPAAASKGK